MWLLLLERIQQKKFIAKFCTKAGGINSKNVSGTQPIISWNLQNSEVIVDG
jgi:hypothetical protein